MTKKTYDFRGPCPVCGGAMAVSRLSCDGCGSELSGRFRQSEFASLSGEDLDFLRAFLRARGVIKDVETLLGISYPTVRGRLERLVERLGLGAGKTERAALEGELAARRDEVLDKLAAGEITADEAERRLAELRG